jgi:catechol 2,3-dioxygenase-like lactoylglutathione lyase family enzyme
MANLSVSHVCLWVDDQDAARDFYIDKLGFELRQDTDVAGFRWLTVGPTGQPELELALNVPGPPAMAPETEVQVRAVLAKGATGGVILAVDDCRAAYDELRARGVEFTEEPSERPYGIDAAFRDPSGNSFRLVQPITSPAPAG